MFYVPFSDRDIAYLAQLVKWDYMLQRRHGVIDPEAAQAGNRLAFLAMAMFPGQRVHIQIGGPEMGKEEQTGEETKGKQGAWWDSALDEHENSFDPNDPIRDGEIVKIANAIWNDMSVEEFLKRTA